jgi:hypothetical protein
VLVPDHLVYEASDPPGDTRLAFPDHPTVRTESFDLTYVSVGTTRDHVIVTARFARPVEPVRWARIEQGQATTILPMTVDVYLDTTLEAGQLRALPARGFHVPASEAWDRVLVLSSVPRLREDGVVKPAHLTHRNDTVVGVFDREEVGGPILGVGVVVLATSADSEGFVRAASAWKGDCTVWEDLRCTLIGEAPPIIDAVGGALRTGGMLALDYPGGARPPAQRTPVVFQRGKLLGAAPVDPELISDGTLATVFDEGGTPMATAIVVSVVGDTASLELLEGPPAEGASTVIFGGKEP